MLRGITTLERVGVSSVKTETTLSKMSGSFSNILGNTAPLLIQVGKTGFSFMTSTIGEVISIGGALVIFLLSNKK